MSEDEYWRVEVSDILYTEASDEQKMVTNIREKLMDLADKVESGIFSEIEFNYFANNHEQQTITVGHLGTTLSAAGVTAGSHWDEVEVRIPDSDLFVDAYQAFIEDASVTIVPFGDYNLNEIEGVTVFVGDNRSEGDTTKFIKIPQKS